MKSVYTIIFISFAIFINSCRPRIQLPANNDIIAPFLGVISSELRKMHGTDDLDDAKLLSLVEEISSNGFWLRKIAGESHITLVISLQKNSRIKHENSEYDELFLIVKSENKNRQFYHSGRTHLTEEYENRTNAVAIDIASQKIWIFASDDGGKMWKISNANERGIVIELSAVSMHKKADPPLRIIVQ